MPRFEPTYIALPAAPVNREQGTVERVMWGGASSYDRMLMFAASYLAGTMAHQEHYSWMISEFKEWLSIRPDFTTAYYCDYWSDIPGWDCMRLLERHHISIWRGIDVDDDPAWERYRIVSNLRNYRDLRAAKTAVSGELVKREDAKRKDSVLAAVFDLEGRPQEQAAIFATSALLTQYEIMEDITASPAARVAASKEIQTRAFGTAARFLPKLHIDVKELSRREAVSVIMNEVLKGKLALDDAERLCKLLEIRDDTDIDDLKTEMAAIREWVAGSQTIEGEAD